MLVISSSKGGVHICPGVSDNDSFIHLYLSVSPFVLLISLFIYCFCEGDIAPYKSTIGQHFMKFRWLLWVKYHLCRYRAKLARSASYRRPPMPQGNRISGCPLTRPGSGSIDIKVAQSIYGVIERCELEQKIALSKEN